MWGTRVSVDSDVGHPPLGLVSLEAAGNGEMVVQRLVVRAFVVPHSCPKSEGMNVPPGDGEWATRPRMIWPPA
jgi:hypothetical protein